MSYANKSPMLHRSVGRCWLGWDSSSGFSLQDEVDEDHVDMSQAQKSSLVAQSSFLAQKSSLMQKPSAIPIDK